MAKKLISVSMVAVLCGIGFCWSVLAEGPGPATRPAPAAGAQPAEPDSPPAASQATSQPKKLVPFHNMKIDAAKRQIVLETKVCLTEGMLEFLVCREQSKEHESILCTPATPSDLHAALMALGLTPGKPARSAVAPDRETMVAIPPLGAELKIRLRWKNKTGAVQEADPGDWLEVIGEKKKVAPPKAWVFVGSDLTPAGTYWADLEGLEGGEVISVANFPTSVIDVPFESSSKDEIRNYRVRKGVVPAKGTAVDVIIEPLPNAEKAPHARVILELDRFGRCSLNGREIPSKDLTNWGRKYMDDHTKGEVTLRVDGRALADDIRRVQDELRLGGVYDVNPQILAPSTVVLPRSEQDARESLKYWDKRFTHPRQFIREPGEEAKDLLQQIKAQQEELKSLQALYEDYAQHLAAAAKKYQATSQAARERAKTQPDEEEGGE